MKENSRAYKMERDKKGKVEIFLEQREVATFLCSKFFSTLLTLVVIDVNHVDCTICLLV